MHTGLASVSLCSIVYADSSDSNAMNPFSDNMKVSPARYSCGLSSLLSALLLLLPLGG